MSAALDLRSHYRAVRERINARALRVLPPPAPPPSLAVPALIYDEPIGPRKPVLCEVVVPDSTPALVRKIVQEVGEKYGLSREQLCGEGRAAALVRARHELFWRLRRETTWSLPRLGRALNFDHTTLLNGIRKHQARLDAEAGK